MSIGHVILCIYLKATRLSLIMISFMITKNLVSFHWNFVNDLNFKEKGPAFSGYLTHQIWPQLRFSCEYTLVLVGSKTICGR